MILDEFNLICYVSLYGNLQSAVNDLQNNHGNFDANHVLIITVHLNKMVQLIILLF